MALIKKPQSSAGYHNFQFFTKKFGKFEPIFFILGRGKRMSEYTTPIDQFSGLKMAIFPLQVEECTH